MIKERKAPLVVGMTGMDRIAIILRIPILTVLKKALIESMR